MGLIQSNLLAVSNLLEGVGGWGGVRELGGGDTSWSAERDTEAWRKAVVVDWLAGVLP